MWAQVATQAGCAWDRDRHASVLSGPAAAPERAQGPSALVSPCWALCVWVEMIAKSVVRKQWGYRVFFAIFLSVGHNSLRETFEAFHTTYSLL